MKVEINKKKVPAEGNPEASIMIVGEGPGKEEVRAGRPFVGSTGRSLDRLLLASGLNRADCWITNITKTLPTYPKEEFFFTGTQPTPAYFEGILEVLTEIKRVQPNIVCALGNYALWALTGKWGILKYRGSILPSNKLPNVKILAMIHPAWIERSFMHHRLPLLEWDFLRAKEQSEFPEIRSPQWHTLTDPNETELEEIVKACISCKLLTFDTEWYGPENPAYIGFTTDGHQAYTIPFNSLTRVAAIKEIMGTHIPKTAQNATFDVPALARYGIVTKNLAHDTLVAWHSCWGDLRANDLGTLGSVLTEIPYYKTQVEFVGKDDKKGQEYCGTDCIVTHTAIKKIISEEFQISGGKPGYDILMGLSNPLMSASIRGLLCDHTLLLKKRAAKEEEWGELQETLETKIGRELNVNSHIQVAKLVYDELKTKRKKRSTEQAILMDIAASLPEGEKKEILTLIVKVRQARKVLSNYLNEKILDKDGRIRCDWVLSGTINGRVSTRKPWWNGVPIQTFPWEHRDIFISDPGHTFVGWDLEQAEARVVAILTRNFELIEDMENGVDIHTKLAAALPFDLTYEELLTIIKEKGKDDCDERNLSKTIRHASNYVLTPFGLKLRINKDYIKTGVGVTLGETKVLHAEYMRINAGLEPWWEDVLRIVRTEKSMTNPFGRRRNFLGRFSARSHEHRDAVAFYPQSTIADATSIAIREMHEADLSPMIHMHDGGICLVPDARVNEAIDLVKTFTTKEFIVDSTPLTIPSEVKVGPNWKNLKKA